ncbi:hypothetical protein JZK55_02190 [Dissulfurispira thermophila]|uniref:Amidohydrolase-related domain-containing protein n=1 Tax=Dissulfurispira thermophila TaxID=2715679 RepID=A0A7G1H0V0_9BACT|nr:amidohydrolase family protein [Dissulfurispira thermophila]BCB95297.1 hypothetical protein JZK55_02190 [Dissulfurispira thermophila]
MILNKCLNIESAVYAVYKKGTYGVFLGKGVSDIGDIKNVIQEIQNTKADFLKIVNSGIVSPRNGGMITPGGFTLNELRLICSYAKEIGIDKISCHVNGDASIKDAITSGVSCIEHGYFISDETLLMMKEMNVSWTPTVYAMLSFASCTSGHERQYIESIVEKHLSSINHAASMGIRLCIGTDSGAKAIKHGGSFFEEMRLFKRAGLSLKQILNAACMDKEEIDRGNYLVIKEDFIDAKKIEAVFANARQIF